MNRKVHCGRWGGQAGAGWRGVSNAAAVVGICFVLAGCSDGGSSGGAGSGGGTGSAFDGEAVPAALVGSWYAGSGYTSAPYNPSTGSWGRPNGKGLVYVFQADNKYTKAFQSYESNGACSTGFTAFESGPLWVTGSTLVTRPSAGHMVYESTCASELNSDTPLEDLQDETFSWELMPSEYDPSTTVLRLRRNDGAESIFSPL